MKIDFPVASSGDHAYCVHCHAEAVTRARQDNNQVFVCGACGKTDERCVHMDGSSWIAEDGELWHETAAVFVRNPEGKYLFFERTLWPRGLTIPAGHVDPGELPEIAAVRELAEETGLKVPNVRHAFTVDITHDSCRGGADSHRWHLYVAEVAAGAGPITIEEEGKNPTWLTIAKASKEPSPPAIHYLLAHFKSRIEAA